MNFPLKMYEFFFFFLQDVRVMPDSIKQLPLQLNDTIIYYENELLIVESEKGLSLVCNMNFQYCTFHVSGNYVLYVRRNTYRVIITVFTVGIIIRIVEYD